MKWMKVNVAADRQAEDIVSEVLLSVGAQGVSVEGDDEACAADVQAWDYLDESVLSKAPYSVCAYYLCDGTEADVLAQIGARLSDIRTLELGVRLGPLAVSTAVVDEQDWENAWKAYFKPVRVSDFVVIKPTWEEYRAEGEEFVIEIDPGMAFGTGNHETTRLCVRLMEEYMEAGMTVADVGCGSGILSIAAAKFGADRVYALDFDPVAVEVTKRNAELNGCGVRMDVMRSDLLQALPGGVHADILVANIIADVIIRLAPDAPGALKKNGMFLCSGIIESRLQDVRDALAGQGFRVIEILSDGEWRAMACKYKG